MLSNDDAPTDWLANSAFGMKRLRAAQYLCFHAPVESIGHAFIRFDPVQTPFRLLLKLKTFIKEASHVVPDDKNVDACSFILTEDMAKRRGSNFLAANRRGDPQIAAVKTGFSLPPRIILEICEETVNLS